MALENVFLSIGTNQGNRSQNLRDCLFRIEQLSDSASRASGIYLSESWGFDSEDFYNMVIQIPASNTPRGLLEQLQEIEQNMGRRSRGSSSGYMPRVIDIDILTYGTQVVEEPGLKIPHPRAHLRNFVLRPWMEIAPDFIMPGQEVAIAELYEKCTDNGKCERIEDV